MKKAQPMPAEYLELAQKRVEMQWPPYKHPEDFGYDFRTWVSPYTIGAHSFDGIAMILQDWASDEGLKRGLDVGLEQLGRDGKLLTNRRLDKLLLNVFGLRIEETYATNVFPFVKPGSMSSGVPQGHMDIAAKRFTVNELEMARPRMVLAFGRKTYTALRRAGVRCYGLPHPAARIGGLDEHEERWRGELCDAL